MKNPHKHHIIPVYRCKELGIDPDFDENFVTVERLDHARIHWGYKCDDLEPLFEYVSPAQWIIDLIPRGDNRDVGAAVITARGEIDGIDMSGKNNPSYIDGRTSDPEWRRERGRKYWAERPPELIARNTALKKEFDKIRNQTPERIESERKRMASSAYKATRKKWEQSPRGKASIKKSEKTPERIEARRARRRKNKVETGYTAGYSRAKKKIDRQGVGTLEKWLT